MSALLHIKNLILNDYKARTPEIKVAVLKVLSNIDIDLDINGYETSPDTDKAIQELDEALCAVVKAEDEEERYESTIEEDEEEDFVSISSDEDDDEG